MTRGRGKAATQGGMGINDKDDSKSELSLAMCLTIYKAVSNLLGHLCFGKLCELRGIFISTLKDEKKWDSETIGSHCQ